MKKNIPVKAFLFILALVAISEQTLSQRKKKYSLVTDFGARADDKTDCYPAFVRAAAVLSKAGGGVLVIPKGRYYIASYKIHGGDAKNTIDDIVFRNCTDLEIIGNNSIIRVNGNFSRKSGYSVQGLSYKYSFNNTVCPFVFSNCRNTVLKNIILYGEVDKIRNDDKVVEGMSYGVCIYDNAGDTSNNITLQNITAHHFAADGFLIRSNGKKHTVINCKAYNNARQGLSIVKGKEILVYRSDFDSTGKTGNYGFHWPAAGIDIENEFNPGDVDNVVIRRCQLRNNRGFQIVTTLASHNVLIDSCFIKDQDNGYEGGLNGVGMYSLNSTLSNCIIFGSIQVDIADQGYRGEKIQSIRNNIIYSGQRAIISSDFNRPVNIMGNIIVMLPNPVETYFPYIQNVNCRFNDNIVVLHPDRIKNGPPKVTSLVQYVKEGVNNFWLLNKNDLPKVWLKGYHYYYAAFTDTKLLGNQFFPVNEFTQEMKIPEKRFVTDMQQDKIVSNPLFSSFRQTYFDARLLGQADLIRKYTAGIVAAAK